jgi:hypothetical protein
MRAELTFLGSMTAIAVAFPLSSAWAYLDPGTGSFILQTLLGGLAGVLVVGRLYWTKLKLSISRVLHRKGETDRQ